MTELEKDINNLRSGLKSVESVSHADLRDKSRSVMYLVSCIFALTLAGCLYAGARLPEKAAAGAGRQVCVGGEPVHHCGQFQLLWRGGLPHRGQGAGKSPPLLRTTSLSLSDANIQSWLPVSSVQLLLHAFLTPSVTSSGKLTVGVKCSSFLPLNRWCFISQTSHCLSHRGLRITLLHYSQLWMDISWLWEFL